MVLWLTTNLMMGIPVDETCNGAASDMNMIVDSMTKLMSLNSPEYRKVREEAVERAMGIIRAERPEMFDPYQYQENKDADIIILDNEYNIDTVIALGKIVFQNKEIKVKGRYEK